VPHWDTNWPNRKSRKLRWRSAAKTGEEGTAGK
jgi:hypothetical protein